MFNRPVPQSVRSLAFYGFIRRVINLNFTAPFRHVFVLLYICPQYHVSICPQTRLPLGPKPPSLHYTPPDAPRRSLFAEKSLNPSGSSNPNSLFEVKSQYLLRFGTMSSQAAILALLDALYGVSIVTVSRVQIFAFCCFTHPCVDVFLLFSHSESKVYTTQR